MRMTLHFCLESLYDAPDGEQRVGAALLTFQEHYGIVSVSQRAIQSITELRRNEVLDILHAFTSRGWINAPQSTAGPFWIAAQYTQPTPKRPKRRSKKNK